MDSIRKTPFFSIIIPARNEEQHLPTCLAAIHLASAQIPEKNLEIIVVLNRCTDATESVALAAGCITTREDSKNLSRIRNAGASLAHCEVLITVDADSCISKNMLQKIAVHMADNRTVGGGVLILPERWSLGIIATGLFLLPLILWHRISGGLFFCRKRDFEAIGGFDESLSSVEDIDFAKRLRAHGKKDGRRFVHLRLAYIVTSCRKFDHFGDWYFVRHPWKFLSLLKGRNQALADQVWYDFERKS